MCQQFLKNVSHSFIWLLLLTTDYWDRGAMLISSIQKSVSTLIYNNWITTVSRLTKSVFDVTINVSTDLLKWRSLPDKTRECTLPHSVQRHLGQLEDRIFWVSLFTVT